MKFYISSLAGQDTAMEIEMVKVPAGTFRMGGSRFDDEQPIHEVAVPEFFIGKFPVTQAQWRAVMGTDPSYFKGDNLPVEQVSCNDVQEFCLRLSKMTGQIFRLPTEAEWEYACRAGTETEYCFGDDENLLGEYAWFCENSDGKTHPVGEKKPNQFGLYDMHGNVWEWCSDDWSDNYEGAPTDGKVLRGGSWRDDGFYLRSAFRLRRAPGDILDNFGFRVVCANMAKLKHSV